MLEFMVACTDTTTFRFDSATLWTVASVQWPGSRRVVPQGRLAAVTELFIELPSAGGHGESELAIHPGGAAIGLDAPSREEAARVLAWLAQIVPLPGDGSVVVVHWASEFYPLRPGATAAQLLQDASS